MRFPGPYWYFGAYGPMQVNGTVDFDGAAFYGIPAWNGPGRLRWESASMGNLRNSALRSGGDATFCNGGLFTLEANCHRNASISFTNLPGGTLAVTLTSGFVPASGSSFVIGTDLSRQGEFASTPPSLPSGLKRRVRYAPDAITLKLAAPSILSGQRAQAPPFSLSFRRTDPKLPRIRIWP